MNFKEYKEFRDKKLKERNFNRMDCLNPFKAMDYLIKDLKINNYYHKTQNHLLNKFKKNTKTNYNYTISNGVRDSLRIIKENFKGKKFLIPSDTYPKYLDILKNTYHTTYQLNNKGIFNLPNVSNNVLLLECPITPSGRLLNNIEINKLKHFINKNNDIIIDTVYAYNFNKILKLLKPLIDTKRCYILHSLSKTYISPEILGINIFPKKLLINNIKNTPNKTIINKTINIISQFPNLPIIQENIFKNEFKNHLFINKNIEYNKMGYFRTIDKPFEWFIHKDFMVVNNSIFGSKLNNSVITCLYYLSSQKC